MPKALYFVVVQRLLAPTCLCDIIYLERFQVSKYMKGADITPMHYQVNFRVVREEISRSIMQ